MSIFSSPAKAAFVKAPPPCDRCQAGSLVMVGRGDLSLTLCGHHFSVHEPGLAANGWGVVADLRRELSKSEQRRTGILP